MSKNYRASARKASAGIFCTAFCCLWRTLIARWKELYEFEFLETKAGAAQGNGKRRASGRQNVAQSSFASSTAKATGKDKRSVERAAQRGKVLGRDLKELDFATAPVVIDASFGVGIR